MINLFGKWKDKATQYVDVRFQLLKLGMIERISNVLGFVMLGFGILTITLAIFIFLGIGMMESFSVWLDSRIAGAFATTGFFIILLLIVVGIRKGILTALSGVFIRIMTEGDDDDDDDDDDRKSRLKETNNDD